MKKSLKAEATSPEKREARSEATGRGQLPFLRRVCHQHGSDQRGYENNLGLVYWITALVGLSPSRLEVGHSYSGVRYAIDWAARRDREPIDLLASGPWCIYTEQYSSLNFLFFSFCSREGGIGIDEVSHFWRDSDNYSWNFDPSNVTALESVGNRLAFSCLDQCYWASTQRVLTKQSKMRILLLLQVCFGTCMYFTSCRSTKNSYFAFSSQR